jgi:hypothetical protein
LPQEGQSLSYYRIGLRRRCTTDEPGELVRMVRVSVTPFDNRDPAGACPVFVKPVGEFCRSHPG